MEEIQHQQMGYDRAATMFAPDGRILQVEYAEKTIRLGSPSIGIVFKNGVLVLSDRRQKDKLIVEESINKVNEIDEHIVAVSAGVTSDSRILVEKARVAAQQHRVTYDSAPNTESIVREVADIMQQFTQYGGARPFGVSMMFAGINGEAVLYTTDVTGGYLKYRANAIGEDDDKIKKMLRERYTEGLDLKSAMKLAVDIFKEVLGKDFNIERFDAGILEKADGKTEEKVKLRKVSGKEIEKV